MECKYVLFSSKKHAKHGRSGTSHFLCIIFDNRDAARMERRSISRAHIDPLIYLALEPNNGGILLDLSHKGMRISVAHPLHAGTQMNFSFGTSPVHQVQGIGRIAWIDRSKKSAGICFVHLSEESTGKISELLIPAPQKVAEDPSLQAEKSDPSPELPPALPRDATKGQAGKPDRPDAASIFNERHQSAASVSSDGYDTGRNSVPVAQQADLPTISTARPPIAAGTYEPRPSSANDPLPIITLSLTYPSPPSRLAVIGKAILRPLGEFGWGLENDWHVIAGLVLIIAGFIALCQLPPLVLLAVPLWIAGAFVLTGKKRSTQHTDPWQTDRTFQINAKRNWTAHSPQLSSRGHSNPDNS